MFFHLLLILKKLNSKLKQSKPVQSKLWLRKLLCISLLSFSFVASISQANAANPKILVYGDSLSAAYGIAKSQGWVALLQKKLADQHYQYDVINASISGETTSGGLTRLETALSKVQPNIIIIELGANDGLRGLPVKDMTENLDTMITQSKKANAKILLIGMKIPPNYGPKYTEAFSNTYPDLSLQHKVSLVPFLLENVAAQPKLIQDDGLHPNVSGQPIILDNIWPKLKPLLKR
ncbi:MAG: arylesterase [Methylotenera sp.]|nr:arylesterase [Methylotenera sp.]MDI1307964.1 arylesterase [Methylotenera sp.]